MPGMASPEREPDRWAWAEVDLDAVAHNVDEMRRRVAPSEVWVVVKANGYGHGAVPVARSALAAGATGLCVALVREGETLRQAGIDGPIMVLSEQPHDTLDRVLESRLTPTVYTPATVDAISSRATDECGVHLHIDTGMQRVGAHPDDAVAIARRIDAAPGVRLDGVMTHLAVADEPEHDANRIQLDRFDETLEALVAARGAPPHVHAANSAAALAIPRARRSFVRMGIATYGISPGPGVDQFVAGLRPAMRLVARVSHVKRVEAGSHVSYGWRHRFDRPTTVATLPLGYADGVPRRLGTLPDRPGADVLVGGRRCPIVGVVTMDQLMVDVGDLGAEVGDEAVLLGRQGDHEIRAEDWAERLGTIGYEVVCGISARVPRHHLGG